MKFGIIGIMGMLLAPLLAVAQMPPAPPGFVNHHTRAIQSPKHMAGRSGAQMIRPTIPDTIVAAPLTDPTNHAPPVASIEWHQVMGGPYGTPTLDMTNAVGCRLITLSNGINIQHLGLSGKTYEVQVNFGFPDTNWWTYMRLTMPRDDLVTTGHPIYQGEKQRFFRVRSN